MTKKKDAGRSPGRPHEPLPDEHGRLDAGGFPVHPVPGIVGQRGIRTATGEFQAMMEVSQVNCGPVTLLLDSHKNF